MTTKTDKIYEIAETLGYDGPRGSRITDALTDLKSVVGGGGGGGVDALIVTGTVTSGQGGAYTIEADKTAEEIFEYVNGGGKLVFLFMPPQEGSALAAYSLAPLQSVTKNGDNPANATFITTNLVPSGAQAGVYVSSTTLQGTDRVAIMANGRAALAS